MINIRALRCDAIVNAANSGMTGYYVPCHRCIDNCIHTYAEIQLRLECARIMQNPVIIPAWSLLNRMS